MCRFINWKLTILYIATHWQIVSWVFWSQYSENLHHFVLLLFWTFNLGCQVNANSSFICRYYYLGLTTYDNIHLVTCGTYHIFCCVLRLELWASRRVWSPPSCRWYHLIPSAVSSQCPHGDQCCTHQSCAPTARTCAAPAPAPPGSRRPHLARPRPGGEMWPSWCGASQPSTCPV